MDRHRDDFFLATKTRERGYEEARAEIRRSLERLRTDRLDLIQLHSLSIRTSGSRRCRRAARSTPCVEAREQGLVRFIGVTGHGWTIAAMHQRSLERFDFDSVLLPWNWFCAHHETYAADFEATLASAQSARSRSRPSSRWRAGPGPPACRAATAPGISRSRASRTSAWPCTGSWRGRGSFSTRSATSTCCPRCCARPTSSRRARPRCPTR